MPRSILIRIHMSRIIVYLDRDLNIFQASRRATGQAGERRIQTSQIEMDRVRSWSYNDEARNWLPSVLTSVTMWRGRRDQTPSTLCQGIESRRRRLLNADVEICRFCRACADHQASLIVSAESLYSLFTRSLNDSSCWNYCTHRGKGTRYSHLLHTFVLQRRTHLFGCSVPTEFTQAEVMSGSEWITEISECNLPPAETSKGQCGANPERANHRPHEERD